MVRGKSDVQAFDAQVRNADQRAVEPANANLRGEWRCASGAIRKDVLTQRSGRSNRDTMAVYSRDGDTRRVRDSTQQLQRVAENTMLRIRRRLVAGGAHAVSVGVVHDNRRIADRVIDLVVEQRRDGDRTRRKECERDSDRRETSAPEGANHR
jgi:hypothetical protein